MRLLLLTYEFPPLPGGIGRYCATLSKALGHEGHEVIVIIPRQIEGAESALRSVRVQCLPWRGGHSRYVIDAYRLYRAIRAYQPDGVLATHGFSLAPIGLLSLVHRFPFALTIIGSDVRRHASTESGVMAAVWRVLTRRALECARGLICISEYSRDVLQSAFRVVSDKSHVVYIGLDGRRFAPADPERVCLLRKQLGLEGSTVLLTVSRLVPRKGHDQVLKALARIPAVHPTVHYLIAGSGPNETNLRRMVIELGLEPCVSFVGHVPEESLNDYYDLADIYVMPSREEGETVEGFGLAFIEAGARGLPVIGGRHGGVPEAVLDGKTGYLVDALDSNDLSRRIAELLEKPTLRRKLGEQGRKRALEDFTARSMARRTAEVLLT